MAIAVGVRYGEGDPNTPARVHYVRVEGDREAKLAWLEAVAGFKDVAWQECAESWHAPFLPEGQGDYFAWPLLTDVFPWQQSGAQFKRTWPIAPTPDALERRWRCLLAEKPNARVALFSETRDRKIDGTYNNGLPSSNEDSIYRFDKNTLPSIVRYGNRSFGRAFSIYDTRIEDYLRPEIFRSHSDNQVYLTSLLTKV